MNADGKLINAPEGGVLQREDLVEKLNEQMDAQTNAGDEQAGTARRAPTKAKTRVFYKPNRHDRRKAESLARKEKK
jgi:hypothetical protein